VGKIKNHPQKHTFCVGPLFFTTLTKGGTYRGGVSPQYMGGGDNKWYASTSTRVWGQASFITTVCLLLTI